jgi:hypothetical protein
VTFRPNTRRIFTSWARAAVAGYGWAFQTGWKHRIAKARGGYRVTRTERPADRVREFGTYWRSTGDPVWARRCGRQP